MRGESQGLYRQQVLTGITWRDALSPSGSADDLVRSIFDRRDPLLNLALEAADGEYTGRFDQVTALWPLMLPYHADVLAAHAHPRLIRALTKNRNGTEPLLEGLGAARGPVGAPAMSALILGLAAKNGGERTRAVDAIVDLSDRGLLNGRGLGTQLAELLGTDVFVGSRLVSGLADAARAGTSAAAVVVDCLIEVLPSMGGRRDAHQFIDLLAQVAVEQRRTVTLPEPFADLARTKQSSMLAKACRRVPQPQAQAH